MFALHEPIDSVLRDELKEYDDLTAALLARRGVKNREDAAAFLSPSYDEHIGDPMKILNMPKAAARVIRRFNDERTAGEAFRPWMDRVGGATVVAAGLQDLGVFPSPTEAPDFYVDYGETGPFVAEVGDSECAV